MTDKIAEAQAQVREAEARLANAKRLLDEARDAKSYPPEPNSDIITFSLFLGGNGISNGWYRFAALKAGGRWYTTGKSVQAHGVTWEELVDWLRRHHIGQSVGVTERRTSMNDVDFEVKVPQ